MIGHVALWDFEAIQTVTFCQGVMPSPEASFDLRDVERNNRPKLQPFC